MKQCVLIGFGISLGSLTGDARQALLKAPVVSGAGRLLQAAAPLIRPDAVQLDSYKGDEILSALEAWYARQIDSDSPVCLFSGDSGFYSGAASVYEALTSAGWKCTVLPGISAVQAFSARIGRAWQDWQLESVHGNDADVGMVLSKGAPTFLLTGGVRTVSAVASYLCAHGAGDAFLTAGSRLCSADEKLWTGTAEAYAALSFSGAAPVDETLACVLIERSLTPLPRTSLPDDFFERVTEPRLVPMTKRLVRSAITSLLAVSDGEIVWDIGCGTGAVTVDLAHIACCHVYAVDSLQEACSLTAANVRKAALVNVDVVHGSAPEVLETLPEPDAVFVGGSSGNLSAILSAVYRRAPHARVVIASVTLETPACALSAAEKLGLSVCATQLSVSESSGAGSVHILKAQNPVTLIALSAPAR